MDDSGFGRRLRQAREGHGLRQRDLAVRLDVDPMQISRWERGQSITLPWLARLGEALDVSLDWLVMGRGAGPELPALDATGTEG